jgi:hypothetical protein
MQPHPDIDANRLWATDEGLAHQAPARPFYTRVLVVLWPAFMVAAMLEGLIFVVVDPSSLQGLGKAFLGWPAPAVYSLSFLLFWALVSLAAAVSLWLDQPGPWQST